jgi:carbon monoxide dehydrogenase subunit G
MALEITKTVVIKAPPTRVWDFLTDPRRVAGCMPGAAITGQLDERSYGGTMTVKVGPVASSYRGRVVFERLDPGARTAEIVATGQDVRGKGGADLRLTSRLREIAPGETEVTAVSQVNITGILAQMGRGMVEDVSDQLFQLFSQRLREALEREPAAPSPPPPEAPPASAAPGAAAGDPTVLAPPAGAAAAAGAGPAAPAPAVAASAPAARPGEALDLGALGARAAARALTGPAPLWLVLLVVAALVYLLLR